MNKFICKVLAISTPIFILLVSVNYYGDAAKLFHNDYEKKMVEIINSGSFVTNINNYDERVFQKELISSLEKYPQIALIGSSRTMLINSNSFPNNTFLNNSVSGASLQDLIAIYQMYREKNAALKKIVLGIDPWMFNQNNPSNRWKSIELYYNSFFSTKETTTSSGQSSFYKYTQLFSFSYFQTSIRRIGDRLKGGADPIPSASTYNDTNTKLLDGSLTYGNKYRNATQKEIDGKINKYVDGEIYGLNGFDQISPKFLNEFKTLVESILSSGTELELFLSPYAPRSYEVIEVKHPLVKHVEELIRSYSNNKGIKVMGSYNPKNFGLDETFFYDGMHSKEIALPILFAANGG